MISNSSPSPASKLNGHVVNVIKNHHDDAASSTSTVSSTSSTPSRPSILHLGDEICYNPDIYRGLTDQFDIIRPPPQDLEREVFKRHLRDRTWGNFSAIMKPFWSSGSEMHPWDFDIISLLPESMKIMAGAGAGFDWVNTDALAKRGIIYANGANASTESVANTALYHIISVFTHATASSLAARSLSPAAFKAAHNHIPTISHNPRSKTLGIVGLGLIGFEIAKKARIALGMNILYHDLVRKPEQEEDLQTLDRFLNSNDGAERVATFFPELNAMLPYCDCVLLATPSGNPILTAETIALLPRGARVVNIARGTLLDENALANAIESGHISTAGLDVHADEPGVNSRFVKSQPKHRQATDEATINGVDGLGGQRSGGETNEDTNILHGGTNLSIAERVQLTCHTGGASIETNRAFEELVLRNVEAVLQGREALTPVNARMIEGRERRG